ncbi:MAG: LysM peptidoglycan-binding domain-containing protein, partial [Bacteroidota bacterium]|nr:LysM peptidoglycan-binding domain-containing protein [Bacteroidota bacterium]
MKNISILFVVIFVVFSCSSIGQQKYASHQVREGETVSSIANKYNVTVYEIYRLNPEAKSKLYPGLVLILPGGESAPGGSEISADGKFILHTVAKGETLYKLSKKYDVAESEIKRYNKHLYSAELRRGETVKIPNTTEAVAEDDSAKPAVTNRKHIVKPKETKYGLASMYGITIAELEQMNPEIKEGLQIGTILNVPDKSYAKDAVLEESKYGFYEVKPKENFFRLTQRWDMTEDELIALNPSLNDGLKSGMILKLPKEKLSNTALDVTGEATRLADNLTNRSTKNIAVMLPFNLGKTVVD